MLKCLGDKTGRVCKPCKSILQRLERAEMLGCTDPAEALHRQEEVAAAAAAAATAEAPQQVQPDPTNPAEYCSTVPPHEQVGATAAAPPSVMVPVGVLKRLGSRRTSSTSEAAHGGGAAGGASGVNGSEGKQVMFSDGIRPGGDLAELDGSSEPRSSAFTSSSSSSVSSSSSSSSSSSHRRHRRKKSHRSLSEVGKSLLSADMNQLPLVEGRGLLSREAVAAAVESSLSEPIPFIVNKNLIVHVKLVNCELDIYINNAFLISKIYHVISSSLTLPT